MGEALPFGMTKKPMDWDLCPGAFMCFACFAIKEPEILDSYKSLAGVDLLSLVRCYPVEAAIDDATGSRRAKLAAFMDWLVVEHYGESETS